MLSLRSLVAGLCHGSRTRLGARPLRSQGNKAYSSVSKSSILVSVDEKTKIAKLELNKKPVNSLTLELLTELQITIEKLENERKCRAVILTSAVPGIFCAGLDILELYNPKVERLREFWRTLQNCFMKIYGSKLPIIAAINGHSPAGGCLVSVACDYRVMAEGKYLIGLNETHLGIVAPFWFQDVMVNTCGHRETERALQLGLLYSTKQALDIGLVDELVGEDKLVQAAEEQAAKWMAIPDFARQLTKNQLRTPLIQKLQAKQDEDIEDLVQFMTKDAIQKSLGAYLDGLKNKKQK